MLNIRISNQQIKDGKLNKIALADLKHNILNYLRIAKSCSKNIEEALEIEEDLQDALADNLIKIDGDKIIFNTNIDFWRCDSLISLAGIVFNGDVSFFHNHSLSTVKNSTFTKNVAFYNCNSLKSLDGSTFYGETKFTECESLGSISGATFNGNVEFFYFPNEYFNYSNLEKQQNKRR
jgi:hypothetical protein